MGFPCKGKPLTSSLPRYSTGQAFIPRAQLRYRDQEWMAHFKVTRLLEQHPFNLFCTLRCCTPSHWRMGIVQSMDEPRTSLPCPVTYAEKEENTKLASCAWPRVACNRHPPPPSHLPRFPESTIFSHRHIVFTRNFRGVMHVDPCTFVLGIRSVNSPVKRNVFLDKVWRKKAQSEERANKAFIPVELLCSVPV